MEKRKGKKRKLEAWSRTRNMWTTEITERENTKKRRDIN